MSLAGPIDTALTRMLRPTKWIVTVTNGQGKREQRETKRKTQRVSLAPSIPPSFYTLRKTSAPTTTTTTTTTTVTITSAPPPRGTQGI